MTTIVDRTPDGIIYRAEKTWPVPNLDVLTLLFDSEHSRTKEDMPIHISAADPSLVLTVSRARTLTQATSAALRKHYGIGQDGAGKDIVSAISTGHYLVPVLAYGIIGAGGVFSAASAASTVSELSKQIVGAGSKVLVTGTSEVPRAYVVADEAKIGAEEIVRYVKERVAGHKQLRGGVVFVDAIPKSPSGKILRRELRVLAEKGRGAKL